MIMAHGDVMGTSSPTGEIIGISAINGERMGTLWQTNITMENHNF